MGPIDYVMHPETEIISLAIKYGEEQTQVIFGEDFIRDHLEAQDWSNKLLVAHNMSAFDAMIFAWRFKVQPRAWGCTLAMARPIHSKTTGNSLAKLVEYYQLGVKDNTVLLDTKGRHLEDFTRKELQAMRKYNCDDTDQCYALFHKLKVHYNAAEMWQIDSTIRMLVEPKFMLNKRMLEGALSEERIRKHRSLEQVARILYGHDYDEIENLEETARAMLASAPKFAELLKERGVRVPMKPSPSDPDKQIPALAKTDEAFLALQDHDDEVVAVAAAARLDVKSTILQTRLETFMRVGKQLRGKLPIPLHYCGADTTGRWSGFLYNPQNLHRVDPDRPKPADALRKSMCAPPGYKVVVADLSGIELRVNHFLWKVPSSMALYKTSPDKADLYVDFASKLYNVKPDKVTKAQRQIGKIAHLGLGFGAGAATFQRIAKLMGGVDISLEEAQAITQQWRSTYEDIVTGWRRCHDMLPFIARGDKLIVDPWAMMSTSKAGIHLPSGRIIRYPALREEPTENGRPEWKYGLGRHQARIYAGKIDENIVQALARDVIAGNAYQMYKQTKLRPSLAVHDELVYVVPQEQAEDTLATLQDIMRTPPTWWPQLITWSQGDVADNYGDAK
jgi:DNA polymerase I-like protein with 3'-5' exonuclease and polymerase domains